MLRGLEIVNWNVFDKNPDFECAIDFVLNGHNGVADVICLQEVSYEMVEKLRLAQKYNIAVAEDFYNVSNGERRVSYLVILSRHNVIRSGKFRYKRIQTRSYFAKFKRSEEGKEYLYVDIVFGNENLRVFNVHLDAWVSPRRRLQQFRMVCRHFDRRKHNIICGDFNISDRWYVSVFNFLGGWYFFGWRSFADFKVNETSSFVRLFERADIKSIFKDRVTYPSFQLQLDDILVPQKAVVMDSHVLGKKMCGSDHCPIGARVGLPPLDEQK